MSNPGTTPATADDAVTITNVSTNVTADLVNALTAAWQVIRSHHRDVPDVFVAVGAGTAGRRNRVRLGHFATSRWRIAPATGVATGEAAAEAVVEPLPVEPAELHEVFLSGEGLRRGPASVLATLLHEAAHGMATVRDITDTSDGGRYHNAQFKRLAQELGLVVTKDGPQGWSSTTLGTAAEQRYAELLVELGEATRVYRVDEQPGSATGRDGNLAVATCECPRKIRVARTTLRQAAIICDACHAEFRIRQ